MKCEMDIFSKIVASFHDDFKWSLIDEFQSKIFIFVDKKKSWKL